ncbi:transcriptional repressor general negative regulator of transcription subunit 4 [Cladophialophora chaetospira]|uniref:Transcriptional repressor general negative regulator of transcription subunit 4 n=1 Tax=Cladophialophora chaetospira TaxID=386627 RepID=A0AA39CD23_9EURO|nr:transcriptional repressor general negative regulator of transcription subunit 4 [Cladophialophora chaetospira]
MSAVGTSATEIVNGIRTIKTAIDAFGKEDGSKSRVDMASQSISHDLASIQDFKAIVESTPDGASSAKCNIQERVTALQTSQKIRQRQLDRYKAPLGSNRTLKERVNKVCRTLAWPLEGEKDLQQSQTRLLSSEHAVQRDATLFTAERNQARTAEAEKHIMQRLDLLGDTLTAGLASSDKERQRFEERIQSAFSQSQNTKAASDLQDLVAAATQRPTTMFADLIQRTTAIGEQQAAFDRKLENLPSVITSLLTTRAVPRFVPSGMIRRRNSAVQMYRSTELDEFIKAHGNIPLSQASPSKEAAQSLTAPETVLASVALAALYTCCSQRRIQLFLLSVAAAAKNDPIVAALVSTVICALWRMASGMGNRLSLLSGDSIIFEDMSRTQVKVPLAYAEYPGTFHQFLKRHFVNHPCFDYILEDRYHINVENTRGLLVTTQTWSGLVKPGVKIAMSILLSLRGQLPPPRLALMMDSVTCQEFIPFYTETLQEIDVERDDEEDKPTSQPQSGRRTSNIIAAAGNTALQHARNLHACLLRLDHDVDQNVVYVIGLIPSTEDKHALLQTLRGPEYFGQYGEIEKIVVRKAKSEATKQGIGVYVTFARKVDAALCINTVDGSSNGDRVLRAQFGTTKYCLDNAYDFNSDNK